MNVYLGGKKVRLDPAQAIGKGGEADVYSIGRGLALKVYKGPDHPDLQGHPDEQRAAAERIAGRQAKLRAFPRALPARMIVPKELCTDRSGTTVLGFSMKLLAGAEPLLRYAEPAFRAGMPAEAVVALLRDLHALVGAAHAAGVVIGDFNDLNVLVASGAPHLIDCDSFQFGSFVCDVFTERFVDPLSCDPQAPSPVPVRPHSPLSDWYAFAVMLMQSLLLVGPYGGVYRPRQKSQLVAPAARPLRRITVFHTEVIYPRPAIPWRRLPDDLLQELHAVFEKDRREIFPRQLLDTLRFQRCPSCGIEHARPRCPDCAGAAVPAAATPLVTVRGKVTARRVLQTSGLLLATALHEGKLLWLSRSGAELRREDGTTLQRGPLAPGARVRLQDGATLIGQGGRLERLGRRGELVESLTVDSCGTLAAFDCNARHRYWVEAGRLLRDGALGPELVGEVLAGQTRFWVGERLGFGFYRAGALSVAFVFDAERRGLNDSVAFPRIAGRVVAARCTLSAGLAYLFLAVEGGGRLLHRCLVFRRDGGLEASAQATPGDGSWLGGLGGACALGDLLFVPTDDGLARVECRAGQLQVTREFPDTAPFVDAQSRLLVDGSGLYVVGRQEITSLRMS
jgi:hypothetical protein